jgi:fibronectin-binding autotransporter adhesin
MIFPCQSTLIYAAHVMLSAFRVRQPQRKAREARGEPELNEDGHDLLRFIAPKKGSQHLALLFGKWLISPRSNSHRPANVAGTCPNTSRRTKILIFSSSAAALLALQSAVAANTGNNYTGSTTGSLLVPGNWSLGALPTITNDAVFTANTGISTGIRTLTAGSLTVGSWNVTASSGTFSIRNETATATNSILTLGGAGNLGNSVSGTSTDLIYVATGATFNIIGANGGGGTGVLNLALGQSGTFNIAGTSTISSVISGSGFGISKTGAGTLTLSGGNTYTDVTTIDGGTLNLSTGGSLAATTNVAINTGGTLLLSGTGDQVNNGATTTLAGGTLRTNGASSINETVGALTLSASSTIDFGTFASGNTLRFADSSAASWTGTLNVWNWTEGVDQLFFGTSASDLTSGQLGQISLYSGSGTGFLGTGAINSSGSISAVPEPSSMLGALSLLGLAAYRERRWFLRCQEARTPRTV